MRLVFITGLTGQDGSYLAERCLARGDEVHGLVRRSATDNLGNIAHLLDDPRLTLHTGDLADAASLWRALERAQPQEVYNLASQSDVALSFETPLYTADINAGGLVRLLEAIRALGLAPRIYQAGSSEMFGLARSEPQDEASGFHPRSPYAAAKAHAHHIAVNYRESYGMFICNGILFNHESPRRGLRFVTRKVARAAARIAAGAERTLRLGNLDARRDWGYAPEYVDAMTRMLAHPSPGDYVIATGESHTVRELVALAFAAVGLDWEAHVQIDPALYRPAEVPALRGDAARARELLGWSPTVRFEALVRGLVEAERV